MIISQQIAAETPPLPEELIRDNGTGIEPEDTEAEHSITQPFDPKLIRVETQPMTIDLLIKRMKEGEINLTPDFQRKGDIWNDKAKSRLIESLLIRIPLPAFYFDATNDESWIVVDGLQRLTTLKQFIINKGTGNDNDKALKLGNLEFLTEYNEKKYDNLPRNLQRRIDETQVTVYLIKEDPSTEVKFTLFKRINTGGLPLSPQEIRHAINQGEATKLLARLCSTLEFKKATDNGIRDDRMADRECALRFLAFTLTPYTEYKAPDLDKFLNETMKNLNQMSDQQLKQLEQQFLRAMNAAFSIFGAHAFRKRYQTSTARNPINKSLFEAWSVNLGQLDDSSLNLLIERKSLLNEKFIELMKTDRSFESSISQATATINYVKERFRKVHTLIQEVLS